MVKTRRNKGTGTLTEMTNGRYRAYMELNSDPTTGSRRRVSATGRTRTEALTKAKQKIIDYDANDPTQWDHTPTVAEWSHIWLDTIIRPRRTPNTYRTYRNRIEYAILPLIGNLPLNRLRSMHMRIIEQTIMDKGGSSTTARLTHLVLSNMLDAAIREELITRNPFQGDELPQADSRSKLILTPEQASLMIRMESDPKWHLLWRLLFTTGMRVGEAIAINLEEIQELNGITCIHIIWQLKQIPNLTQKTLPYGFEAHHVQGSTWMTRPKTVNGQRLIPLPDDLADELHAYTRTHPVDGLSPILLSSRGNPLSRETVRYPWNRALQRAGLPHVNIHSARHTCATSLARLGVSDAYRMAIIGHARIETTNRIYTHADAQMLLPAVNGVASLLDDTVDEHAIDLSVDA